MTTSNEHNNAPAVAWPWLQYLGELVSAAKNRDASRLDQEAAINAAHADLFNILRTLQPTIEQDAPAVPQGWKLVPVGPTPEMIRCAEMWEDGFEGAYARALAATPAPAPAQGEPFGHFRAEPFGWTDCAEDDEGAIALYERPQEVGMTDEQKTWAVNQLMGQAQVFASVWSLVGGRFDFGNAREEAEKAKTELRSMVVDALRAKGGKL